MEATGTYTLLIADDEPDVLDLLQDFFVSRGYRVLAAHDGEEAVQLAQKNPDLVLLDVAMPNMNGLDACRRLRGHLHCPIIFLTARVEEADALEGFEAGADDYILKPFSLLVLEARVSAHLAREKRQATQAELRFAGNLTIDFHKQTVSVCEKRIELTSREFSIVSLLAKHPGRTFDRDLIHQKTGGWETGSNSQVVTELIRRIRRKLAEAGAERDPIETVWGLGYRWRE